MANEAAVVKYLIAIVEVVYVQAITISVGEGTGNRR